MADAPPFLFVDDPAGMKLVLRAVERASAVAVDTESDSMHSYYEKVCLLQLSTGHEAFVVDPLALGREVLVLGPRFADPGLRKVFHGADYDVVSLKRSFGFEIHGIFDTMVAAQYLALPRLGLADLVAVEFGEVLDKRFTKADWARRPLGESQLHYSYLDVKYLLPLAGRLEERLAERDLLEEAGMEFRRLEEREPVEKEFDPDSFRRIRGSRDLDLRGLAILRELHVAREGEARRTDRPSFKILAADTMLRIAAAAPRTENDLARVKGATPYVQRKYSGLILAAVARGIARGQPPPPGRRKPGSPRLSPRQQRQMERIKEWRKTAAAERGVPTVVVLGNPAVLDIVIASPRSLPDLAVVPGVGEKRARLHGEAILDLLAGRGRPEE
jgi:ribonuclease D